MSPPRIMVSLCPQLCPCQSGLHSCPRQPWILKIKALLVLFTPVRGSLNPSFLPSTKISQASEMCYRSSLMETVSVRITKYFNCVHIDGTTLSGFEFSCVFRILAVASNSPWYFITISSFFFFQKLVLLLCFKGNYLALNLTLQYLHTRYFRAVPVHDYWEMKLVVNPNKSNAQLSSQFSLLVCKTELSIYLWVYKIH